MLIVYVLDAHLPHIAEYGDIRTGATLHPEGNTATLHYCSIMELLCLTLVATSTRDSTASLGATHADLQLASQPKLSGASTSTGGHVTSPPQGTLTK